MADLVRDQLIQRLKTDLIGPGSPDEVIADRPSDRYLTGILYPVGSKISAAEDEQLEQAAEDDVEDDGAGIENVSLASTLRPSSAGLSFAVEGRQGKPAIHLRVLCGTYSRFYEGEEGGGPVEAGTRHQERWRRTPHDVSLGPVELQSSMKPLDLTAHGLPGLTLHFQAHQHGQTWTVTAVLVNTFADAESKGENEPRTFFQTELHVQAARGSVLVPRPFRRTAVDEDTRAAALIYRDAMQYATGHTCSAEWDLEGESVARVRSTWLPRAIGPGTSAGGDAVFSTLRDDARGTDPLSAKWLSEASGPELKSALGRLPDAYAKWIAGQKKRVHSLPAELRPQAEKHLATCQQGCDRMRHAVELIGSDAAVRDAFRLANRAMRLQRQWAYGEDDLKWRPFQVGFQLLSLTSLADRSHADRKVMDLLWFPTGGGKTEAYLALTAFILFLRRLKDGPVAGAGVAVLMRYTLRLLTTQQFERAATLICACEHLRRSGSTEPELRKKLGSVPFAIGLWVGQGATPNKVSEAVNLGGSDSGQPTPKQLVICPACRSPLGPCVRAAGPSIRTRCDNEGCVFGGKDDYLPVWTVDEDVYRERPSLVIGTVDKFALITRQPANTGTLFGLNTPHLPPDLIIQDELHLISGPLGTISALYEIAVDELCTRQGVRPKVIGSTATIRRAATQIKALFDRDTYQFPAACIDWHNSCFAVRDDRRPGRLYVGVTTAGRSPKFTLQATYASLLQAAADPAIPSADERDPYWTLVGYFNSLRELGGALVLVQDDVGASLQELASRRGEQPRRTGPAVELTSRRSSSEIPVILKDLKLRAGEDGAYDVLLASNMISVGVDIPRLGLMVVNGQPKLIAEYIQATSRVGRDRPGLIVTVFNNGKTRDRSHYETFATWHSTLYREVEATSVTPFASRALDKALHAVLVAMVRHFVPGMQLEPRMDAAKRAKAEVICQRILDRATHVDPDEKVGVKRKLKRLLDEWSGRTDLQKYWEDFKDIPTLLISAEQAAASKAAKVRLRQAWPTQNSMRDVEPTTPFRMVTGLKATEATSDGEE